MADINGQTIVWIDVGVERTTDTTTQRWEPFLERLLPRLTDGVMDRKTIKVYYERLVFNNFALMHIHRHVRQYFEAARLTVRTLTPSQKWGVSGKGRARKDASVEAARRLLTGEWLERLEREERKHDLADAVLMVKYLQVKGVP